MTRIELAVLFAHEDVSPYFGARPDPPTESGKMAISIDEALNLSVMITRGDRGWLVSMATQGDARGTNVVDYEFADMRWDKSLVETEILVTAWLAGRGFDIQRPWHTTELTGSQSGPYSTEAGFVRQRP